MHYTHLAFQKSDLKKKKKHSTQSFFFFFTSYEPSKFAYIFLICPPNKNW